MTTKEIIDFVAYANLHLLGKKKVDNDLRHTSIEKLLKAAINVANQYPEKCEEYRYKLQATSIVYRVTAYELHKKEGDSERIRSKVKWFTHVANRTLAKQLCTQKQDAEITWKRRYDGRLFSQQFRYVQYVLVPVLISNELI